MSLPVEDELNQKIQYVRSLIAHSRMSICTERDLLLEEARLALVDIMQDVDLFGIQLRDIGTNSKEMRWMLDVIEERPTNSMVPTMIDLLKGRF